MLIALSAATIHELRREIDDNGFYDGTALDWQILIIYTASSALVIEGIMILLRFLNPSCLNNRPKIFAALVKYL